MDDEELRTWIAGTSSDTTGVLLDHKGGLLALTSEADQLYDALVAAGIGGITAGNTLIGIVAGRMMARLLEPPPES